MWLAIVSTVLLLSPSFSLRTHEPPPPASTARTDPVEGWVDVRLNHFMASDTRTFPMRYYYSDEFRGQDIVIFIGGEWAISPGWVTAGLAYELARDLNAGLFYTEHRYYGGTRPTEDSSVSNLRWLTIDQALADLAQFIQYVKSDAFEGGRHKYGRVALVGCSYAGTMATWMRLLYPHLVDAAFSDSGPLHAQEDFPEYLEVITEAIRTQGGQQCLSSIEAAMEQLETRLAAANGPAQISQLFNTCSPLTASGEDLASFYWWGITETFAYLVQYATPGDIPQACAVLNNPDVADPVQRLANWITSQSWNQPCMEASYANIVDAHINTSFDAYESTMRLWTYQTCVEFGWYQTTTSSRQPFLSTVPLEYFHQMCKDFFGASFDENFLRAGIERTNLFFGGWSHMPDKVVSVVGSHDPWAPMGPNATHAHQNSPVLIVPEVSHCVAIRPTGSTDDEVLEATKIRVLNTMYAFINGDIMISAAERMHISAVLLLAGVVAFVRN